MTDESRKNHGRKLKSFLLLPKFQLIFVALNWITLTITVGVAYFTVNKSFDKMKMIGKKMRLSSDSGYMKFLNAQESVFVSDMLIYMSAALVVSLIITIVLSHKVAGPVYRIKKYFLDLDLNKPEKLSFRSGDFFNDIPEIVNDKLNTDKE